MHDCENERVRGISLLIDCLRFGGTGMVKRFAVFGLSRLIPNSWQLDKTQPYLSIGRCLIECVKVGRGRLPNFPVHASIREQCCHEVRRGRRRRSVCHEDRAGPARAGERGSSWRISDAVKMQFSRLPCIQARNVSHIACLM